MPPKREEELLTSDIEQMLKRKFLLFLNPVKLWLADM